MLGVVKKLSNCSILPPTKYGSVLINYLLSNKASKRTQFRKEEICEEVLLFFRLLVSLKANSDSPFAVGIFNF